VFRMDPREFVERFSIRSAICCFSGGKDSLAATHYFLEAVKDMPDLEMYVLHVDTTISLPGVQEYVKQVADQLSWPLHVIRPKRDFFTLASKWGMPTLFTRWCCFQLKLRPMFEFAKRLRSHRVMVTGIRRAESTRRRDFEQWILLTRPFVRYNYHPIIEWSDEQVDEYIRKYNLPINPVSREMGFSGECICGVFCSYRELMRIRAKYPEFMRQFEKLEERFQSDKYVFYASQRKISPSDLFKQVLLDEFV